MALDGIEQIIKGFKILAKDKKPFKALGVEIGKRLEKKIKEQIASGDGLTPISAKTATWNRKHRIAKRIGGPPLLDTGRLLNSIKHGVTITSSNIQIRPYSRLKKAKFLEFGGTTPLGTQVPERPYIAKPTEEFANSSELMQLVEKAAEKALKNAGLI